MKYTIGGLAAWFMIVQILVQIAGSSNAESDLEDSQAEGSSKQQGSWSQWWSYDGISGPDYWNINKQWRLCSLGRKQSPVDVQTDRLVYDHLLGPIHLSWLPASVLLHDDSTQRKFPTKTGRPRQEPNSDDERKQAPVKLRLLNSGRGVEAWLEPGAGSPRATAALGPQEQLILSRGPLSYAYKLFKIELHSAGAATALASGSDGGDGGAGSSGSLAAQQQLLGASPRSSEHLIDGRAFDAELQLHFYNKHLASSAAAAQQLATDEGSRPNLFAAIGVFVVLVEPPSSRSRHHRPARSGQASAGSELPASTAAPDPAASSSPSATKSAVDFIFDNLGAIQNEGDSVEVQLSKRHIESLITSKRQYVTYQGSINRPPCAETVDWILLNKAHRVDRAKFESSLEKLNTNQENIRPIKALHRRLLRTTINALDNRAAADEQAEEDDDGEDDDDLASDMQVKQSVAGSGGTLRCTEGVSNKNCSGSKQEPDEAASRQEDRRRFGSCSMKPNYAYQLRYKKQLL